MLYRRKSSLQQLTSSQDQAVLPRARLQSQPSNTDRHDQVQADQGRGRQPQHREAAHPAVVPEGEHPNQEEEINGRPDNHSKPKHRSSTELHDFILHFTSVTLAMRRSGTIGAGLDRPPTTTPHPIPNTTQSVPNSANLDLQISARYVSAHHRNPQLVIQKMPNSHGGPALILTSSPLTTS